MMKSPQKSIKEWQKLVEEQEMSGQSKSTWCRNKGISYSTFAKAYERVAEARKSASVQSEKVQWTEAKCGPKQASEIKIEIGKFQIKVGNEFSEAVLMKVCRTLAGAAC